MTVDEFLERIQPALEALAESQEPWEARRDVFAGELGALGLSDDPLAAQLVQRLDSASEDDRAAMLASGEFGLAEVPAEQVWQAYLAENGPAWDGSQDSWEQFRQWFTYYADERGLGEPATGLMGYLDGQSAAEWVSTLARYGVSIAPAAAGEPGSAESGLGEIPAEDVDSMMREVSIQPPRRRVRVEHRRRRRAL